MSLDGASQADIIEKWVRRAIAELKYGDKDFAEELMVDILFIIGRGAGERCDVTSLGSPSSVSASG